MIFIERDTPLSKEEIEDKLDILYQACATEDDDLVRDALREVVPTFKKPEEVNEKADKSAEMKNQREFVMA